MKQMVGTNQFPVRLISFLAASKHVVSIALFPDATVAASALLPPWNDRLFIIYFLKVEKQRVISNRNHSAILDSRIGGYDPVFFHITSAGINLFFRSGINGIRQVLPMDKVFANGMSPVLHRMFRRVGLIKEVPAALPET